MKKIALCFLISYDHILNKEDIWREWIEHNADIINVYFHYTDYNKIKSEWIKQHVLPASFIAKTTYFHVVPAYMSTLFYAMKSDEDNQWFCFLTDSCVPIITPEKFRKKFMKNQMQSIMRWKPAWWNVCVSKRANLAKLSKEYHIGNDPWFILCKEDALTCNYFAFSELHLFSLICKGGLANESIFIIMLKKYNKHHNIINEITHAADWDRMSSDTSPYVFREATNENIRWIDETLKKNKEVMFLRKVDPSFPNEILEKYCKSKNSIYKNKNKNKNLLFYIVPNSPLGYIIAGFFFLLVFSCIFTAINISTAYHSQYMSQM